MAAAECIRLFRNPPRKSLIPLEPRGGFLILVTGRRGLIMLMLRVVFLTPVSLLP
jgi:hypothetical protein